MSTSVFFITALLLSLGAGSPPPQPSNDSLKLPTLVGFDVRREAGVAVLVLHHGEVLLKQGFGLSDPPKGVKITSKTAFFGASLTKTMTATALADLVAAGKIQLEVKVQHYLPEFPYPDITVAQLAYHTSGLDDLDPAWLLNPNFTSHDVLISLKKDKPLLLSPPGSTYHYSNTGYTILSLVVEVAAGKPFASYLNEVIFKPMAMSSSFVKQAKADLPLDRARPFTPETKTYAEVVTTNIGGCVGLYTTLDDLERWIAGMRSDKLLNAKARALMFTQDNSVHYKLKAALGWLGSFEDGRQIWTAAGRSPGVTNLISYAPEDDLWIVQLSNRDDYRDFEVDYLLRKAVLRPSR